MKTAVKVLITTLAIAIPAFILGAGSPVGEGMWRAIWPWDAEVGSEPSSGQIPFFMLLGAMEAISLGLAVSFLAFGRKAVANLAGGGWRFNTLYFGAAWLLGNWWFHDSIHMVNGYNWTGLLVIEYAFHFTLMAVGAMVCYVVATHTAGVAKATPRATPTR